ncbi:MAG: hypothetical protein AAFU54_03530 [Chloroflexota bacterium]
MFDALLGLLLIVIGVTALVNHRRALDFTYEYLLTYRYGVPDWYAKMFRHAQRRPAPVPRWYMTIFYFILFGGVTLGGISTIASVFLLP